MLPHWESAIRPLAEACGEGPAIEIGSADGRTTVKLAELGAEQGRAVHAIDPTPRFDTEELERRFAGFSFHRAKSHDALAKIEAPALVLIDGDHNWHTVHGELVRLERGAAEAGCEFPLVLLHDVEWPYARRDMYYDPDGIPEQWRQPWARRGIAWGESLLDESGGGINPDLANALSEGGPGNGVLTAVEDFLEQSELPLSLRIVHGHAGLGVLASATLLESNPALRRQWDRLRSPRFLLEQTQALSEAALRATATLLETRRRGPAADAARLAAEIRRRLGPPPQPRPCPPVSIVVPNRNGAAHLRRLLDGLTGRTDYPDVELIVVDNGSGDDSVELLRRAVAPFAISIVANHHNESFSDACNQGAALAGGELLLFLNNDAEPFEGGWLRELVACLQRHRAGIAGATLLRPDDDTRWGHRVQHREIRFVDEPPVLGPDRSSFGADPFDRGFSEDLETPVPGGACMLIERELFDAVGGFTHGYVYGGEDIDLGLKVIARGRPVLCSGRAHLVHRLGSTRLAETPAWRRAIEGGNHRLFWERWGPRLRREFELDRLAGGGRWAAPGERAAPGDPSREQVLALGFCLKSSEPELPTGDPLRALAAELQRRGHRCAVLRGGEIDDLSGVNYDIAVHLRGPARYTPLAARLNVLWNPGGSGSLETIERSRYDLCSTTNEPATLLDEILSHAERIGPPTRIAPGSADVDIDAKGAQT